MISRRTVWSQTFFLIASLILLTGCQAPSGKSEQGDDSNLQVHHLEIVCKGVDSHCQSLERVHGLSFGPKVADFGYARISKTPNGNLIGVRAPLAKHEKPIIRTYLVVDDIKKAVKDAEAAGATIAYAPIKQGDTGTLAIYILGEIQYGSWQR